MKRRLQLLSGEALAGLFRLPRPLLRKLAGPPRRIDGQELDLENQLVIRLSQVVDGKPLEERSVEEARAVMERSTIFDAPRPPLGGVRDLTMGRPAQNLRARIYTPIGGSSPRPGVVYFHGGGWTIGSLDTCDAHCARLALLSDAVVVSVDYRLAPEHVFPAAAHDAVNAFDWVKAEHEVCGIDPARIAVAGDSAGGNLAAVVAQARRDAVRYQLLVYPAVDLANDSPSYALFRDDLFLTEATMRWFTDHYVPDPSERLDVRASPLLADDLEGVAPACVVVVGFDPLRDEGRAYAERLDRVGALDRLVDEPSLAHGCMSYLRFSSRARDVVKRSAAALRAGLTST
jgi:acetyl esterase